MPVTAEVLAVPVRRVLLVGAVCGFVPGFVVGCMVGGLLSWAAGAAVGWMHQVSFSTGMQVDLMPFGNRVSTLQGVRDGWFLAVPLVGLGIGLVTAAIGALTAGLVAVLTPGRLGRPDVVLRLLPQAPVDAEGQPPL